MPISACRALAGWAGSVADAERVLRAAGVDPAARGETLDVTQFAAIAACKPGADQDNSWSSFS